MTARYTIPRYRVSLVRDGRGVRVSRPDDAARVLRQLCCERGDRETIAALYVDSQNRIVGSEIVAIGGQSGAHTDPPCVLRGAILAGARGIILGHNHPSGDPTPSEHDRAMTSALERACDAVGIPLLDHLIVTAEGRRHSMLDAGELS